MKTIIRLGHQIKEHTKAVLLNFQTQLVMNSIMTGISSKFLLTSMQNLIWITRKLNIYLKYQLLYLFREKNPDLLFIIFRIMTSATLKKPILKK